VVLVAASNEDWLQMGKESGMVDRKQNPLNLS